MDIGERLKIERQRLGLGSADLAARLGVSKATQYNYENTERVPDANYLEKAHAHGIDVTFVITGERVSSNDDYLVIPQLAARASGGYGRNPPAAGCARAS